MALKQHKKAITRIFILMVVMTLLCVGVFSCTTYMEQERKTFVDMSQVELVQLETPAADAPAMKITTSAGTIVAELFPEQAPAYVKQFTELAESGYYDNTYVFSVEDGVYFEAGSPNPDGSLNSADATPMSEWNGRPAATCGRSVGLSVCRPRRRRAICGTASPEK